MTARMVAATIWVDDDLDDGYVRVEDEYMICMSISTYRALSLAPGALSRCESAVCQLRGTFPIPRAVVEPEAASDLRQGLSLAEPVPSAYCAYGPCILPATTVHADGFSLCDTHTALMADWDDLTA